MTGMEGIMTYAERIAWAVVGVLFELDEQIVDHLLEKDEVGERIQPWLISLISLGLDEYGFFTPYSAPRPPLPEELGLEGRLAVYGAVSETCEEIGLSYELLERKLHSDTQPLRRRLEQNADNPRARHVLSRLQALYDELHDLVNPPDDPADIVADSKLAVIGVAGDSPEEHAG